MRIQTNIDEDHTIVNNLLLFWHGPFSQWEHSPFTSHDTPSFSSYNCCEQFMMAEKARLFDDFETLDRIMEANSPRRQKELGRKVENFDEQVWREHRYQIVCQGNYLKFSQNPHLREVILNSGDLYLVEASPYDNVWGIGLGKDDPLAADIKNWEGLNLLGKALMHVRELVK